MKSRKKFGNFSLSGKGYYIALILCAVAIGISGYLYYANQTDDTPQLGDQDIDVVATQPQQQEDDVPVAATVPDPDQQVQATEPAPTVIRKPIQTGSPLEGEVVAAYAMDALSYNPTTRDWRTHNGIDLAAEAGSSVHAAAEGTVYTVYEDETMGYTVVIRHQDGYVTCYSSLGADVAVAPGDQVTLGQKIGTVGNTALMESALGDHIHFSVTRNDEPVDPQSFLAGE